MCRSYGFEEKTCPIIYTLEGTLIGDGRAFVDHVKKRFNKQIPFTKEITRARAKLNTDENEDRMKKNRDGETLSERVKNYLDKIRKKNVTQMIDDAFYEEVFEKGIPFKVRRTNVLRNMTMSHPDAEDTEEVKESMLNINRTMDIPDEMLQR